MNATIIKQLSFLNMSGIKPNYSALVRFYNVDRHTLKKHYEAGGCKQRKKRNYSSYFDEYYDIIKDKLEIKGITYKGIYLFLVDRYKLKGSYSNFKTHIKKKALYKPKYSTVPHVRYETPIGKQLQADWKENIKMESKYGEIIEFNLFSSCLSHSRLHYFIYSETKTEEAFIRCLFDSIYHIGGIPKEILTDNMSAIVDVSKGRKTKHNSIIQLEKDLGVPIRLCKAKTPETKGKVESQNRVIARLLAYDKEFSDLNELFDIIKNLNVSINNEPNSTTQIVPIVLFKKEKEYLSPIPSKCILDSYIHEDVTKVVPSTLLVSFKVNEYSVPMKYINKRVKLLQVENKLHIYFNTDLICIHDISNKKLNYLPSHYEEALHKNPTLPLNRQKSFVELCTYIFNKFIRIIQKAHKNELFFFVFV